MRKDAPILEKVVELTEYFVETVSMGLIIIVGIDDEGGETSGVLFTGKGG